jgi:predicted MFS family arabinose efflux permease
MGLANAAQSGIGAMAIPFFTPMTQHFGGNAPFWVMACLGAFAIALGFVLPKMSAREAEAETHAAHADESITPAGWMAVASVFVFFLGAGGIFAYLSFMGTAWGNGEAEVEGALSATLYAAMTAALLVSVLGSRFGFIKPLMGGFGVILAATLLLALTKPHANFGLITTLYGFSMAFIMPYHFEAVTKVDSSSRAAMLVSAATLGGYAIGPTLASYLVTANFELLNLAGFGAFVLALLMVFLAMKLRRPQVASPALPSYIIVSP